jgi:Tfp pilus assembly protein PilO
MNRLSKEKRNQLILVTIVVLAIVTGVWFSVIRSQQDSLRGLGAKRTEDMNKLAQIGETIKNSKSAEVELTSVSNRLIQAERDMPSGDLYLSLVNTIRQFNRREYNVEISQFNPNGSDMPVNLLPKFPYRQVSVSISGVGRYHDIGRFVSDFENRYPTSRILNLDLSPSSVGSADDREKLSFQMDVISLVASGTRTASNP